MTRPGANHEMRPRQLSLQSLGHRQGNLRVVVTPHQLDGALHARERLVIVFGERAHENVPHDTRGRTVVVGPVTLPQSFHPLVTN